jgi:hypothetical protein
MTRINFKIIPSTNFNKQLREGVLREGSKEFIKRVSQRSTKIISEVGNMLANELNGTDVIKSLMGQGSTDLAAHFGLSDSSTSSMANGMLEIVKKSVRIKTSIAQLRAIINITAVNKDWQEFLSLPLAEYISQPSNITIPVIRWMLIDPDIDIGQASYDIVFKGSEGGKFDARIQKVSRSGRAIMSKLTQLSGGSSYVLPDIIRGNLGQNFIEFTIGQQGIVDKVFEILKRNTNV